jgi:hypothetical protein
MTPKAGNSEICNPFVSGVALRWNRRGEKRGARKECVRIGEASITNRSGDIGLPLETGYFCSRTRGTDCDICFSASPFLSLTKIISSLGDALIICDIESKEFDIAFDLRHSLTQPMQGRAKR